MPNTQTTADEHNLSNNIIFEGVRCLMQQSFSTLEKAFMACKSHLHINVQDGENKGISIMKKLREKDGSHYNNQVLVVTMGWVSFSFPS